MSTNKLAAFHAGPRIGRLFARLMGILAVTIFGTASCRAASGGVLDNGGFFSETAKSETTKTIGEMERTLHKTVLIETFGEIPADVKAGVKLDDKAAATQMYDQWAHKQAKHHAVNGVYVLLVKNPAHLKIEVGTDTQHQAFTLKDRDALANLMLGKLRAKQYDDALRDGVSFVATTMKSHLTSHPRPGTAPVTPAKSHPAPTSGGSGWLLPAIIIGLVAWVVIGIVRAIVGRASGSPMMGQPGYGGGGGGFFSSLLGGMFGAAAGMWMYDQFFSHHGSNSAYGADQNDLNSGDGGYSGQDTDYTGSGSGSEGDFGSGSDGGSDWSSGDSGGGDSGGGGDF